METVTVQKNILGLQLPTDPRWVDLAGISLEAILTDHAWCEQKAANSCISLIQRYPDKEKLVDELSPIVTEETERCSYHGACASLITDCKSWRRKLRCPGTFI